VSLALGIGATVAILTAAHQLLFKPLPFPGEQTDTARGRF